MTPDAGSRLNWIRTIRRITRESLPGARAVLRPFYTGFELGVEGVRLRILKDGVRVDQARDVPLVRHLAILLSGKLGIPVLKLHLGSDYQLNAVSPLKPASNASPKKRPAPGYSVVLCSEADISRLKRMLGEAVASTKFVDTGKLLNSALQQALSEGLEGRKIERLEVIQSEACSLEPEILSFLSDLAWRGGNDGRVALMTLADDGRLHEEPLQTVHAPRLNSEEERALSPPYIEEDDSPGW